MEAIPAQGALDFGSILLLAAPDDVCLDVARSDNEPVLGHDRGSTLGRGISNKIQEDG